jgi:predicted O-linked N-acetylglucosamine transferase (SPINDLY family)
LPAQALVFCNLNQSYKLTPAMFSVWVKLLKEIAAADVSWQQLS